MEEQLRGRCGCEPAKGYPDRSRNEEGPSDRTLPTHDPRARPSSPTHDQGLTAIFVVAKVSGTG